MLVLSRKPGEQILIGDDIVVTVHRLSGNRVSIGIDAPQTYRIVRGELQQEESRPAEMREAPAAAGNRIAEHLAALRRAK